MEKRKLSVRLSFAGAAVLVRGIIAKQPATSASASNMVIIFCGLMFIHNSPFIVVKYHL